MVLEVRHFRLVRALAREGSMTRAAGLLQLTQPALSHQLAALEQRLQASLFHRTARGMVLTEAGDAFLRSAEVVLQELDRVNQQFIPAREKQATIRLSTQCYTCYHWLPSQIRRFQEHHQNVDVQVVVEATRKPLEALIARKIDIAIVNDTPARKDIRMRKLFEDEVVAIVSTEHRLAGKPRLQPRDFAAETLITYSVPVEQLSFFQDYLVPGGVKPKRVCQVELTEAIIEMVKANLGVAVLARWAVEPYLGGGRPGDPGRLKQVPLMPGGMRRQWYAATMRSRVPAPHIQDFVALVARDGTPFSYR
jgi:LysR family transcriptional regulator for metE and metH